METGRGRYGSIVGPNLKPFLFKYVARTHSVGPNGMCILRLAQISSEHKNAKNKLNNINWDFKIWKSFFFIKQMLPNGLFLQRKFSKICCLWSFCFIFSHFSWNLWHPVGSIQKDFLDEKLKISQLLIPLRTKVLITN